MNPRFVLRGLLAGVSLLALAGCGDFWQQPSILTSAPPPAVKQTRHEPAGGFVVLVEAPGQPTVARAVADIGAFAQRRGFVRVNTESGAQRYSSGRVVLDVAFRTADSRVVASLHCFGLSRRFVENFYRDFNREYAKQYGEENPIIESDFVTD